jgi:small GTP-binding protein
MNEPKKTTITVLMMGNPNVGKSALFNRLTGANAVVSNYPGTTVDYTAGTLIEAHQAYEIIDVPGTYSLDPHDAAERVAVQMLDATKVERGLYLAIEIIEREMPCLIAVNMIDAAHDKEITVDTAALQRLLGIPVVATTAISGEGLRALAEMIRKAQVADIDAIRRRLTGVDEPQTPSRCAGCGGCGR